MKNKNKLITGIVFLLGAFYLIFNMFTREIQSSYVTGLIVFTILGIAFIKNSKY